MLSVATAVSEGSWKEKNAEGKENERKTETKEWKMWKPHPRSGKERKSWWRSRDKES